MHSSHTNHNVVHTHTPLNNSKICDIPLTSQPKNLQEPIIHIFSLINWCIKQLSMVARLTGSSMRHLSRRSFNWVTFLVWSSGRLDSPNISWRRFLVGLIVAITTIFSCRKRQKC